MNSLNFIRHLPNASGHVFLHHFGTGYQELVFKTLASAYLFSQRNCLLLRYPKTGTQADEPAALESSANNEVGDK